MSVKFQKKKKNLLCSSYNIRQFKDQKANNEDPEEAAHNEPSDLDIRCLQVQLSFILFAP